MRRSRVLNYHSKGAARTADASAWSPAWACLVVSACQVVPVIVAVGASLDGRDGVAPLGALAVMAVVLLGVVSAYLGIELDVPPIHERSPQ